MKYVKIILLLILFLNNLSANAADNFHKIKSLLEGRYELVYWKQDNIKFNYPIVAGTLIVKDKDCFYNRLVWVRKDQSILHYDKCHLFSLAKEDKIFTKGEEKIIINEKGWNICPLICYDIRFPVFCRNKE